MSSHGFQWKAQPIFKGLPRGHIDLLAQAACEEQYESRDLIFHEGDEADKLFLVAMGSVAIELFTHDRGPVTIQTVGVGDVLGWSWLVEPHRWHFDAQATRTTELIAFDATVVRSAFHEYPEFGLAMMQRFLPVIVQRLEATRLQLLDVYHVHA